MKNIALFFLVLFVLVYSAFPQDAVPVEILARTIAIRVGDTQGTAFTIEYEGRLYMVTARHLVAGLPQDHATIQILQSNEWKSYQTVRTLFPRSAEVDIAVFETNERLEKPYLISADGLVTMGQQVWFLGYPYGIRTRFQNGKEAPFVKRGTMSAIDASNADAVVLYVDGFNNPGFSGGPILYWDFDKKAYRILGVVKGYREQEQPEKPANSVTLTAHQRTTASEANSEAVEA